MELRDYIQMLRRGWPTVLLISSLVVGLAAIYLVLTPKRFEATTVLFVSANDPQSVTDLQQGAQFSRNAVGTYAKIVDSAAILAQVGSELRPQRDAAELGGMVSAGAPEAMTLIEIVVAGEDPDDVTTVANAVATTAIRILPTLEPGPDSRALVRVQQTRPAVTPLGPVSPDTERVLAIGLIVGLAVGLASTITVQSLDTRLRRPDDLRELTDIPLVAVVPQQKRAQQGLAVREDPGGAVGEAYRTLRTNLRFLESTDRRSIVFTAVTEDREAAQVPANLAWSLVQAGSRVLLVDLDLRNTTVGDMFGIGDRVGLAEVLMGQADLSAAVHETSHPRLKVVTAGTPEASPADLLSAPAMTNALRRMEELNDYVILHAPPLLTYTDAALVADAAGGTLLTVAAGRTRAQDLATALNVLANVRVTPLGLILAGGRPAGLAGWSPGRKAPLSVPVAPTGPDQIGTPSAHVPGEPVRNGTPPAASAHLPGPNGADAPGIGASAGRAPGNGTTPPRTRPAANGESPLASPTAPVRRQPTPRPPRPGPVVRPEVPAEHRWQN